MSYITPNINSRFIKNTTTFFLLFYSFLLFAQVDTLLIDENDNRISKELFNKKNNTSIYSGVRYLTDTLVIKKIRLNYYFGEFDKTTKNQFFKLLNQRHQIDTTKTLIIHYLDTLKQKEEFPKRNKVVFYDSLNNEVKISKRPTTYVNFNTLRSVVRHEHVESYRGFLRSQKKCEKYHKKLGDKVKVLHFYNINNGHPEEYKKLRWYKDYNTLIKSLFTSAKINRFTFVAIKPNGEFYVQYWSSNNDYEDLILQVKWNAYKTEYIDTIKSLKEIDL